MQYNRGGIGNVNVGKHGSLKGHENEDPKDREHREILEMLDFQHEL